MNDIKQETSKKPGFWKVFVFILYLTFVGFGGGNALLPIYKKYTVDKHKWITQEEFDQNVILTNMMPGPSVVESIAFVSFKLLGFWKGLIVVVIASLPHVIFAFFLFYFTKYIPLQYLFVLEIAVLAVIIGALAMFVYGYFKQGKEYMKTASWLVLFAVAISFTIFTPAPWNMPIAIMIIVISIFAVIYSVKRKITKNKKKNEQPQNDLLTNDKEVK